jgi:adenylate cyclase
MIDLALAAGRAGVIRHEIERKFKILSAAESIEAAAKLDGSLDTVKLIEQRYLPDTGDWTVRVRRSTILTEDSRVEHFLTLKRKVSMVSCIEIETPIDAEIHDQLAACAGHAIRKRRSCIRFDGFLWEVDLFLNPELDGLEIAEIELPSEDAAFSKPAWIGKDVTHKRRYKNARLVGRIEA